MNRAISNSWRRHIWASLKLGIPLIGAGLAEHLIHTTDTVMIGWVGVDELAAVVLGAQYYFFIYIIGAGFSHAAMSLAAEAQGKNDKQDLRRIIRMGGWIIAAFSFISYPLFLFSTPVLLFLGQDPKIVSLADAYLVIAGLAIFPALLFQNFRSFFSALEQAGIILWSTVFGIFLNAFLNWTLIFGNLGMAELGLKGAAIASVLTSWAMTLLLVLWIYIKPDFRAFQLFSRLWKPDWQNMLTLIRLGIPISITILSEVSLFTASTFLMGLISVNALAAHGIVLQIASIMFMVPLGLCHAASVRVGTAYGRKDKLAVARAGHSAQLLALGFALVSGVTLVVFGPPIIAAFLSKDDPHLPEIIAIAQPILLVAAAFQLSDGLQVVTAGILRGLQDVLIPALYAVPGYWGIGFTSAYLLGFHFNLEGFGVWLGLAIGLTVSAIFLVLRFEWQLKRFT